MCLHSVVVNNINNRNNNNNDNNNDNNNNQFSTMEANTSIDQKVTKRKRRKRNFPLLMYDRKNQTAKITDQDSYKYFE